MLPVKPSKQNLPELKINRAVRRKLEHFMKKKDKAELSKSQLKRISNLKLVKRELQNTSRKRNRYAV